MEKKKITEEAFYIPKANIIHVDIKEAVNGTTRIKPLNGYWVKNHFVFNNKWSDLCRQFFLR